MIKRNRPEFFIATQIELFMVIIFIVFLRANIIEETSGVRMIDLLNQKKQIEELKEKLEKAQKDILYLRKEIEKLKKENSDLQMIKKKAQKKIFELQKRLTGTGIGNCLDKQMLANIYCFPDSTFRVEILTDQQISINSQLTIKPGNIYTFAHRDFIKFGHAIYIYSTQQFPECRFAVRLFDNREISKDQFKYFLNLSNRYFYTQPK